MVCRPDCGRRFVGWWQVSISSTSTGCTTSHALPPPERPSLPACRTFVQPNASLDPHLLKKNTLLKRLYLATIGRPLLTRAAALVFTSEQEREQALYGPRLTEWILPVGLDASTFAHLPPSGTFRAGFPEVRGPFLLFVGRLSRQKGLDSPTGCLRAPRS